MTFLTPLRRDFLARTWTVLNRRTMDRYPGRASDPHKEGRVAGMASNIIDALVCRTAAQGEFVSSAG